MNKLTAEKCRDQFEEWMTSLPGFEAADVERRDDGKYSYSETEWCWKSWQASRQALEIALPMLEQQGGWKLVPIEPTPEMMVAGTLVSEFHEDPAGMYRAMIAAVSPQPQTDTYRQIENDGSAK